jgi:hypothetical protein
MSKDFKKFNVDELLEESEEEEDDEEIMKLYQKSNAQKVTSSINTGASAMFSS